MIVAESLEAVAAARFEEHFVRPLLGSWCFSRIPHTLESYLCGSNGGGVLPLPCDGCEKVVLVLLDGLGWRFLEAGFFDLPFVRRGVRDGMLAKLTSEFPSTTVVHLTRLATNLGPAETGVLEWYNFEPRLDEMVCPFLFNKAGDAEMGTLRGKADLHDVWPRASFFATLDAQGVSSYLYQNARFCPSPFTDAVGGPVGLVPFEHPRDAFGRLSERLRLPGKALHLVYLESFDHACHVHGPSSASARAEGAELLQILERELLRAVKSSGQKTMVVLTADHGHADLDPVRTLYLNRLLPELGRYVKKNRRGAPLVPCGGAGRDFFLHLEPDSLSAVHENLTRLLAGRARIFRCEDLVADGFFAGTPRPDFSLRLGSLYVQPLLGEGVFWWEPGRWEAKLRGNHGGLSPQEMEIPWLAFAVGC